MSWAIKQKCKEILSREDGYVKKLWGNSLNICLAYPNRYRTGMDNLGFQTVYRLLNQHPSVLCERVFLPDPGDEGFFAPGPLSLFSLESQQPLREFDIVAFSISFENDYPHILKMLDMARIKLLSRERDESDPIIIGGGICVTMNPEPLADFFDLFLIGEAEEILPEFLLNLLRPREARETRKDDLLRLQKDVLGVYVPALYNVTYRADGPIDNMIPLDPSLPRKIQKQWAQDIQAFSTETVISSPDTDFGTMFLTEVSRGCSRGCRFCAAGYLYRPSRFRKRENLEKSIRRGLETGKKIGLMGTAVSDHPELIDICRYILSRQGKIGASSFRLDQLTPTLLELLKEGGLETLALAPETGSQRLRDLIRKGIQDEDISRGAINLLENGFLHVRLYFMIGLPTEAADDVEAIIELIKRLSQLSLPSTGPQEKRFKKITVSINQFIPKAGTPFQWYPLENIQLIKKKIRKITDSFRGQGNIKVLSDPPKRNYLQSLLATGDRRVGKILLALHFQQGAWSKALKEAPLQSDFFVYRPRDTTETLPWDFIDTGVPKALLIREFQAAQQLSTEKNC
ncbi:MAG: radical SAM protein [Deltaproteobacteria bacterium]|nr:radical SAM protein [Deltaproteobacteria bacterium]